MLKLKMWPSELGTLGFESLLHLTMRTLGKPLLSAYLCFLINNMQITLRKSLSGSNNGVFYSFVESGFNQVVRTMVIGNSSILLSFSLTISLKRECCFLKSGQRGSWTGWYFSYFQLNYLEVEKRPTENTTSQNKRGMDIHRGASQNNTILSTSVSLFLIQWFPIILGGYSPRPPVDAWNLR